MASQPEVSIARLPATAAELFGREADLAWLDACWKEGVHVASIVAWGGVGKSALVNRWLATMRDAGWRGAARVYAWSFYSQGTDRLGSSDEFFAEALRWFGDPDPTQGSAWDRGERLAGLVRKDNTILILDGVEPLQWGPGVQAGRFKDPALEALVKELGAQNGGLCLITSRIALADLEGLSGYKVRSNDLDNLSPEAGAALLRARGAKGTDTELQNASSEYKGHGLALTLLGSYLEDIAKGDIRRRKEIGPLEENERLGGHARRVIKAYERWFGAAAEVAILRMMGLFDRPMTEDEIAAVGSPPLIPGLTDALGGVGEHAWNKALTKLMRVGLLLADQDKRLDAHPLVREHFGEQLRREQPEGWREGHRRLYEHLRKKAKELPETVEEMAPLYAAVVHGCLAGKNQEALDEVYWKRIERESEYFNITKLGAFGSEVAVLSAFFDPPWERLAPGLRGVDRALVLSDAGIALRALGRLSEAAGLMRMGLEQHIARPHWKNATITASNLSSLLRAQGALREALMEARKSVEFADKSGDAFRRIVARTKVAEVLYAMGAQDQPTALFEEAERMQKETEATYPLLYGLVGFWYCDILLDQGRDADVLERASQTLEWAVRANKDFLSSALSRVSLGRAHLLAAQRGAASDLSQATFHLQQAVDGLRSSRYQDELIIGLLARAALFTHTRAFGAARHDLDEALALATRCGFRLHEADAHLGHARLALAEGHPSPAREHLATAHRIIDETGYHRRDEELDGLEAETAAMPEPTQPPPPAVTVQATPTPPPTPRIAEPMPTSTVTFPQPVLDAYRDRKLGILFGSGLSLAPDVVGNFPRWNELPGRLLDLAEKQRLWTQKQIDARREHFKDYVSLEGMLRELDSIKDALGGPREYGAALASLFRPKPAAPGDVHRALAALDVDAVLTTNYDRLFEAADPGRIVYTWQKAEIALHEIQEPRPALFKIHGSAEDSTSVVMTRAEYDAAAANVHYRSAMTWLLAGYTFLLVGYGINDPLDLDVVFGLNKLAFGSASRRHYALMHKSASPTDRDRWQRDMNIQVVEYADHGDLPAILRALAKTPRNPP